MLFCRDGSIWFDQANRFHRHNALYSRPFFENFQLGWCWMHKHPSPGETTMTFVKGIEHWLQSRRHGKGMLQETWLPPPAAFVFDSLSR